MHIDKTKNVKSEFDECVDFINWFDSSLIAGRIFHVPNEAASNKFTGHRQKLIGTRAGVPDYFLALPSGGYNGLFIEMKKASTKGQAQRESQKDWIDYLNGQGYKALFCYGASDAIKAVEAYLGNTTAFLMP